VIKGVDAQVMTNRAMEYTKDVSAMLRRDDVNNDFAGRMNKLTAQQDAKTVAQTEKAEQSRIRGEQEREKGGRQGREKQRRPGGPKGLTLADVLDEDGLPSIGQSKEQKFLDIEI